MPCDNALSSTTFRASTEEAGDQLRQNGCPHIEEIFGVWDDQRSVNFPTVEMAFHSPYRLTVINRNAPNMLGQISSIIAESGINIDNMLNRDDDYAYTLVDAGATDAALFEAVADKLRAQRRYYSRRVIENVR